MSRSRRRLILIAGAGFVLLMAAPAFAQSASNSDDEFTYTDLVPTLSGLVGAAVGAGGAVAVARQTQKGEHERQAIDHTRAERERLASDARGIADDGARVQERLATLIDMAQAGDGAVAAREELRKAIADMARRCHFIQDDDLRGQASRFMHTSAQALQAADVSKQKQLADRAGSQLDMLTERAGDVYRDLLPRPPTSGGSALDPFHKREAA